MLPRARKTPRWRRTGDGTRWSFGQTDAAALRVLRFWEQCKADKHCGRSRREHYGSERDHSGGRYFDLATGAVLHLAPAACAEERGAAGAEQGGVRLRVRTDGRG